MAVNDDMQLLRQYALGNSHEAFATLVHRHINLVYGTALRRLKDPHQAEDVTQVVFLILARKAAHLRPQTVLGGWLYQTARLTTISFLRAERRRHHREQAAFMHSSLENEPAGTDWSAVEPILDDMLARLGEKDRNTLVLRYLEGMTVTEVAATLDLSEAAVRKRLERGLGKLRRLFVRRGVTISAGALAATLATHTVGAAPPGLAVSVAASAACKGAATAVSTTTLLKTTLKIMAWTKMKSAIVVVAALVVAGTASITVINTQVQPARVKVQPDGSFIRLLAVSVGSDRFAYKIPPAKPWQQAIVKKLPSWLASRFDGWMGSGGGLTLGGLPGETNVAVFFAGERAAASRYENCVQVFDDQGNAGPIQFAGGVVGSQSDDGKRFRFVEGALLRAIPRRGKTLGLRVLQQEADGKAMGTLAEFHVANPFFAKYPSWVPEPIPTTKADGDLSATLTGLETGVDMENAGTAAALVGSSGTRATFRLEQAGRPEPAWRPRSVEMSDATGNHWTPFIPPDAIRRESEEDRLVFAGALWPGENAFKLRVEFSQVGNFSPDDLWTVRGLLVPGDKMLISLDQNTTIGDASLNLVTFAGSKAEQPGDLKWAQEKGQPSISTRVKPMPAGRRFDLVKVVDDRGREVEVQNPPGWVASQEESVFGLKLAGDAKSVDCTFALHESRYVEFVAKPDFAPQAKATK